MGWIIAIAGLALLAFLFWKSVDRQTAKSMVFLLKVFAAGIALLLVWGIIANM